MNKNEFMIIINKMNTYYTKLETKPELEEWWNRLKDWDGRTTMMAVEHYIDTDSTGFRPVPGKIKAIIEELTGAKRMSASEAWAIAMPLCSRYTTREQLEELDPEIRKALNIAGHASYLGTMSSDDARRAFMGAWKALGDTEHREQVQRIGSGLKQIGG